MQCTTSSVRVWHLSRPVTILSTKKCIWLTKHSSVSGTSRMQPKPLNSNGVSTSPSYTPLSKTVWVARSLIMVSGNKWGPVSSALRERLILYSFQRTNVQQSSKMPFTMTLGTDLRTSTTMPTGIIFCIRLTQPLSSSNWPGNGSYVLISASVLTRLKKCRLTGIFLTQMRKKLC